MDLQYCTAKVMVTAPAGSILTLAEAKTHLRVNHTADDSDITALIAVAAEYIETVTNRALLTQTWRAYYREFDCGFVIPKPNLRAVAALKYYMVDGTSALISPTLYDSDFFSVPGKVTIGYGKQWPASVLRPVNPIELEFSAGYGTAAEVPVQIKHAAKLLIGHWYENRQEMVTGVVRQGDIPQQIVKATDALLANVVARGVELC